MMFNFSGAIFLILSLDLGNKSHIYFKFLHECNSKHLFVNVLEVIKHTKSPDAKTQISQI